MIDPPRIANLLSAGQHNLNHFVRKRKIKCVKCVCVSEDNQHYEPYYYTDQRSPRPIMKKKKGLQTHNFKRGSHRTITKIEAARNNMPLERPGKEFLLTQVLAKMSVWSILGWMK